MVSPQAVCACPAAGVKPIVSTVNIKVASLRKFVAHRVICCSFFSWMCFGPEAKPRPSFTAISRSSGHKNQNRIDSIELIDRSRFTTWQTEPARALGFKTIVDNSNGNWKSCCMVQHRFSAGNSYAIAANSRQQSSDTPRSCWENDFHHYWNQWGQNSGQSGWAIVYEAVCIIRGTHSGKTSSGDITVNLKASDLPIEVNSVDNCTIRCIIRGTYLINYL